ncbi:hypothetical protein [Phycicoccus sp.]|uniref:hypothetical protein n=1 Tax=Phycicoccus sp. TaxID=1902410 RepID=UPI002C1EE6E0|nr:hypothetical protein [Phycicoccus sp.]HMM94657.1 hypothetical protein [Phycicoccus sp.]
MSRALARRLGVVLLTLAVLAGVGAPASAAGRPGAGADEPEVVVVGAPGLVWSDLDPRTTPVLWRLAGESAVGSLTVRSVRSRTCEVDGWLTLSAGRRAADVPGPCRTPAGVAQSRVADWDEYVAAARAASYGAVPGTLGQRLAATGTCVSAVGAAAAIAAADEQGRVSVGACPLTLTGVPSLPEGAGRPAALRALDRLVARVASAGSPRTLLVAGLADGDSTIRPRAVLLAGPDVARGTLTSPSTRQPGLVQLQDLTATLLQHFGADPTELAGRPVTVDASSAPAAERVAERVGFEDRAATMRAVSPQVTGWLATLFAAWCVLVAALGWRRREAGDPPPWLGVAGVALAAVPVSTFVANLVPWWSVGPPAATFVAVLVLVAAALTALSLAAGRRWPLGAAGVLAVVTLLVLGGDVLTGSRLQLASVFGQNPTVGGRFYGFGNTSYALYGLAVLTAVTVVALAPRPGRWRAVGLGALVLVVAVGLEGHPSLGADFGGPPGLVLGGLLVLAVAAGVRLTVGRVLLAGAGVVLLTSALAVLDWLRPEQSRTHLGEFVQTVLDGGADEVVGRKLAQNLSNLGSPPLLAIAAGAVLVLVVAHRTGWRPHAPGGTLLRAALVLGVVGFAVNDSGLVVPDFVLLPLLPLLAVAGTDVRKESTGWSAAPGGRPSGSPGSPSSEGSSPAGG